MVATALLVILLGVVSFAYTTSLKAYVLVTHEVLRCEALRSAMDILERDLDAIVWNTDPGAALKLSKVEFAPAGSSSVTTTTSGGLSRADRLGFLRARAPSPDDVSGLHLVEYRLQDVDQRRPLFVRVATPYTIAQGRPQALSGEQPRTEILAEGIAHFEIRYELRLRDRSGPPIIRDLDDETASGLAFIYRGTNGKVESGAFSAAGVAFLGLGVGERLTLIHPDLGSGDYSIRKFQPGGKLVFVTPPRDVAGGVQYAALAPPVALHFSWVSQDGQGRQNSVRRIYDLRH